MLKKCAILGLAVLLVGGLALGWLYNETRREQAQTSALKAKYSLEGNESTAQYSRWHLLSPEEQDRFILQINEDRRTKSGEQLAQEQQARLQMDMEKLAAGETTPGEIADLLYGPGWEDQVREYKKHQEQKEIARTASVVCISVGGTILAGCLAIWFMYGLVWLVRKIRTWHRRRANKAEPIPETMELSETEAQDSADSDAAPAETEQEDASQAPPSNESSLSSHLGLLSEGFLPRTLGLHSSSRRATLSARKVKMAVEEDPMDLLMSDEPLTQVWSPDMQWSSSTTPEIPCEEVEIVQTPQYAHQAPVATVAPEESKAEASNSLKEQAEDLQRQLAQVKEMAQNAKQAQDRPDPMNNTLKELAQQVSAIRDYAASQQDRVEKLESGYDWTIIRTFCLRVIRCIDNVEKRIEDLGEEDEATISLEEIRDELLFAMESSGVERYEPEIDSDYRGQEKLAEAVSSRQASNNPEQAGRIAKVLRAGYRYIVDDDNSKVVRTAQVKLYG